MNTPMKDSGIPWIGLIPEHWEVCRHKDVMFKKKDIQEKYQNEHILSLSMNGVIVRDLDAGGKMPLSFDGYQKVYAGNLLMCLFDMDVTPRCVGLIKESGVTSPAYSQFVIQKGNARFYEYLLKYIDDEKCLVHLSKNLRSSLTETDFGAIKTILPPLPEQEAIADFLDEKCREVDTMVDIQVQFIEQLKAYKQSLIAETVTHGLNPTAPRKDSHIDWIGLIPQHWEVCKMKFIGTYINGYAFKPTDWSNEGKPIIRIQDLTGSNNAPNYYSGILDSKYLVQKGDMLISWAATLDAFVWDKEEGWLNQHIFKVIPTESVQHRFFYWLIKTAMINMRNANKHGIMMEHVTTDVFDNFPIPLPSLPEQETIADFLDRKCSEIDRLIALKRQKIDALREYKKSIIYEYVTGKRNING